MPNILHEIVLLWFVLWTKEEIHVERIYPDEQFLLENLALVEHFYTTDILPALLGKFFLRHPSPPKESHTEANIGSQQETSTEGTSQRFCYCDGPDEGGMVVCDNPTCKCRNSAYELLWPIDNYALQWSSNCSNRAATILSFEYKWHYTIHQTTDSNWLLTYDLIYVWVNHTTHTQLFVYRAKYDSWDIQR